MGLPWVRLDSNIGSHDKVLALLSDPSPKRWQAFTSYTVALGWSGGHETDGRIPAAALPYVHGTTLTARLLVKYGLWTEETAAWQIVNYADRQMLSATVEAKRAAQSAGARRTNCKRYHDSTCKCWEDGSEPVQRGGGATR